MISSEQVLSDLTDEQREAVTCVDGPLLIIAGAGSGKTRVITRRVAYLISLGIPPSSILAITFTNKAAGEMKSRIGALMDRPLRDFGQLDQPWPMICTFHSLGLRVLKHYASAAGLPDNFTVYDSSDQEKLVKDAMAAVELSSTHFPPSRVHGAISDAKNRLQTPEAYAAAAHQFPETHYARAYKKYQQALQHNKAVDFDDLLMRTAHLFRDHPEILKELQTKFEYILIDEYQDTNHAQYVVAHALALGKRNICVVGDPDQSIYAWRGADIKNILDFETDYPDAKVVKLERNYRSTQRILQIAGDLISFNRQRKEKRLYSQNPIGEKAKLLICFDEHQEALAVAKELRDLHEHGVNWNQMAVFYRINAMSRVMEDALRRMGMPYRIARGVDFYHRKEIKDVLAYLRVIANPADELSLARIINVPARGIGPGGVKQMQAHALDKAWSLWETLQHIDEIPGLTARTLNSTKLFVKLVERWRKEAVATGEKRLPIKDIVDDIVKTSGLEAYYKKLGGLEQSEMANISELISSAAQFDQENPQGTLQDYLAQVSLVSDVDMLDESGAITLMTLHAAKGLEFPAVAIIALEEGSLPHARVREHPEQLEEERRLCFVGITRAQQQLILSRAARRTFRGVSGPTMASRFLKEMPASAIDVIRVGEDYDEGRDPDFDPRDDDDRGRFRRGQLVRHHMYGVGKIVDISPGRQTRATIEFPRVGRKTLVLEYVKLEPMG